MRTANDLDGVVGCVGTSEFPITSSIQADHPYKRRMDIPDNVCSAGMACTNTVSGMCPRTLARAHVLPSMQMQIWSGIFRSSPSQPKHIGFYLWRYRTSLSLVCVQSTAHRLERASNVHSVPQCARQGLTRCVRLGTSSGVRSTTVSEARLAQACPFQVGRHELAPVDRNAALSRPDIRLGRYDTPYRVR